jgi:hypothetical protein
MGQTRKWPCSFGYPVGAAEQRRRHGEDSRWRPCKTAAANAKRPSTGISTSLSAGRSASIRKSGRPAQIELLVSIRVQQTCRRVGRPIAYGAIGGTPASSGAGGVCRNQLRPKGRELVRVAAAQPAQSLATTGRDLSYPKPAVQQGSPYSITSSARASTEVGRSRPSALAALRLMASSYLLGACTGKSAGFSPLRMRST